MARQYITPGGSVVNETGTREYIIPGGSVLSDTVSGTPSASGSASVSGFGEVYASGVGVELASVTVSGSGEVYASGTHSGSVSVSVSGFGDVAVSAGVSIVLSWVRRTRAHWDSIDAREAPLLEESESYEVEIYSDDTFTTLLRTLTSTTPTVTYTASQQLEDGHTLGDPVSVRIFQISALVGRGYALEGAA